MLLDVVEKRETIMVFTRVVVSLMWAIGLDDGKR